MTETLTEHCEIHGPYEVRSIDLMGHHMTFRKCPKCIEEQREQEKIRDEEEAKIRAERSRVAKKQEAGLGRRHFDCSLENYAASNDGQERALTLVTDYLASLISGEAGNLIMSGKVGTGKTHLAAAMVNGLIERRTQCKLIKFPELMREIKSSWSKTSDSCESSIIEFYSKVPVLLIDEIGVQFGSDTEQFYLSEIIDNRYQEMLPTVLISNLDADSLKRTIGFRCYDRLREDGGKVVAFTWDSYRGTK